MTLHIWAKVVSPLYLAELSSRLQTLRAHSYDELKCLPEWRSEDLELGGRAVEVTEYRELHDDDEVRIVLQLYIPGRRLLGFLKFGQMTAAGFSMTPDGKVADLAERDLSVYT